MTSQLPTAGVTLTRDMRVRLITLIDELGDLASFKDLYTAAYLMEYSAELLSVSVETMPHYAEIQHEMSKR